MENSVVWQLLLQAVLIGLNAVFACAEIAVISVNDSKLEKMADEGSNCLLYTSPSPRDTR